MKKMPKIRMITRETATETFERFLLTKRAHGIKTKTVDTYSQHFHAISKHLDTSQEVAEMTSENLQPL